MADAAPPPRPSYMQRLELARIEMPMAVGTSMKRKEALHERDDHGAFDELRGEVGDPSFPQQHPAF